MMGLLDKLLGRDTTRTDGDGLERDTPHRPVSGERAADVAGRDPDEVAVERYRYMLRTAPPQTVERAHAAAFAKLTPQQRRHVLAELGAAAPEGERGTAADDPQSLARMATRAEMREPGTMERTLGGGRRGGMGMGGMLAGSLLASVAGAFIGTSIAGAILDDGPDAGGDEMGEDASGDTAGDGKMIDGQNQAGAGYSDPGLGDAGFDDVGGDLGI